MSSLNKKYIKQVGNNWVVRHPELENSKSFSIAKYGGEAQALLEAIKWRDEQKKIIDDAQMAEAIAKAERERLEDEERAKMAKAQQKKEEQRIRQRLLDEAGKESKKDKAKRLIVEEDLARWRENLTYKIEEWRRRDRTGDWEYIKHFAKYGNYDDFLPERKGVDLIPKK